MKKESILIRVCHRYLICLTIGPAFLSAAIYLCLARIVVAYGEHISRVKPKIYTITFMSFDFLSLLLQAIGGAIASTSNTNSSQQTGINIMIAGLSFQVVSLLVFISLCAEFGWRVLHRQNEWDRTHEDVWSASRFRLFLHSMVFCLAPRMQYFKLIKTYLQH